MLIFIVLHNLLNLSCYLDQLRIIWDDDKVEQRYQREAGDDIKELIPWPKV